MTEPATGRLAGKTALVTGAASGIGRSVALAFIDEGATVYFADLNGTEAADLAAGAGERARSVELDIGDETSVVAAFAVVVERDGPLDVVIANAGVQLFGADAPIGDLQLSTWRTTIDVNLTGTFLTVKHAVRNMESGGSIIVTGSPTGLTGEGAGFTAYSTSKAGGLGLVRTVAADYAKAGIRVNSVVPGYTETPLVAAIAGDSASRSAIVSRVPLGRPGVPADVTGIMVYLASDESAYATGSTFIVDGGMSAL